MRKRKFKPVFNAIEKRTTKIEVQIPFSNVEGKQKTKNGNGNLNSVFQSRKKTKNEIGSLNSVFQCCRKTENKNGSCTSFFHAIEKRLALRYTHYFCSSFWRLTIVLSHKVVKHRTPCLSSDHAVEICRE